MWSILEQFIETVTIVTINIIQLGIVVGVGALFFNFVAGVANKITGIFGYELKKKCK